MDEVQRKYELTCILSPLLEGADLENTKKKIKETINQLDGTLNPKEEKKQNLAYPINKQGQGIFITSQISILPKNIASLSKELKLNKEILRHLITQITEVTKAKKPKKKPTLIKKTFINEKQIESIEKNDVKPEEKPKSKSEAKKEEKMSLKDSLKDIDKKLDEIIEEI